MTQEPRIIPGDGTTYCTGHLVQEPLTCRQVAEMFLRAREHGEYSLADVEREAVRTLAVERWKDVTAQEPRGG